jgi:hypothetical protein
LRSLEVGAVCPSQGKAAVLIMPICNTAATNHHLCEISSQVAADAHAVVILDGASWHNSHGLVVPSHWLANSVFRSLADIMDAYEMAWNRFATNTGLVRSLCAVAWAPLRPLHGLCLLSNRGPDKETLASRNFSRSVLFVDSAALGNEGARLRPGFCCSTVEKQERLTMRIIIGTFGGLVALFSISASCLRAPKRRPAQPSSS